MRLSLSLPAGIALLACMAGSEVHGQEIKDLYFGEALYYAYQEDWFDAIQRLDSEVKQHNDVDEPELDTLTYYIDDAEFDLGDFELRYRMHHKAGRAITAVLDSAVDDQVRNDAAYRLARIHFQKGQLEDALLALDRIQGKVPAGLNDDIEFLRGNTYLGLGRTEEAIEIFEGLQHSDDFGGYAAYNLGIAYLTAGQRSLAQEQLERAGEYVSDDPDVLAIRDKSNLVLGTILLEEEDFSDAATYFDRVRLEGPFSNQALLSSGWANMSIDNFARAVVPWSQLADREVTDIATQEAMLALPYAYGKLDVHGRAAIYYGRALDQFGVQVERLTESIDSIREGNFLKALVREEIQQDKNWVIRLRSLPESPETYYLMELLASHDFQTGLQNYLDLADLRAKLIAWQDSFDSFDDMVDVRAEHYEPLLPEIDTEFRELDSRMRLRIEQYKMLVKRRDDLLTTPRPEFLATPEERDTLALLAQIETQLEGSDSTFQQSLLERAQRLQGLLTFTIDTEYHERLTRFDKNLATLDEAMAVAQVEYDQFVRTRQAATHSFVGYETPITRLRAQVQQAVQKVDMLMARQGHLLEVEAIEELQARRTRLENYRDKARFALADSYDRATQAQARVEDVHE